MSLGGFQFYFILECVFNVLHSYAETEDEENEDVDPDGQIKLFNEMQSSAAQTQVVKCFCTGIRSEVASNGTFNLHRTCYAAKQQALFED